MDPAKLRQAAGSPKSPAGAGTRYHTAPAARPSFGLSVARHRFPSVCRPADPAPVASPEHHEVGRAGHVGVRTPQRLGVPVTQGLAHAFVTNNRRIAHHEIRCGPDGGSRVEVRPSQRPTGWPVASRRGSVLSQVSTASRHSRLRKLRMTGSGGGRCRGCGGATAGSRSTTLARRWRQSADVLVPLALGPRHGRGCGHRRHDQALRVDLALFGGEGEGEGGRSPRWIRQSCVKPQTVQRVPLALGLGIIPRRPRCQALDCRWLDTAFRPCVGLAARRPSQPLTSPHIRRYGNCSDDVGTMDRML